MKGKGIYTHISDLFFEWIISYLPRKFQSSTSSLTVTFVAPTGTSKTVQVPRRFKVEIYKFFKTIRLIRVCESLSKKKIARGFRVFS